MKLKNIVPVVFVIFLTSAGPVFAATCTLNGKEVPCDQMPGWFWIFVSVMAILGISLLAFWLWMLIDAIKYQKKNKLMWVMLIILIGGIGAPLYYFLEKRKRNQAIAAK